MPDPMIQGAIGGCTQVVKFSSQVDMARAVGTLMGCHPHHFIVVPDAGMGLMIACSEMAVQCLLDQTNLLSPVSTLRPPPSRPLDRW